MSSSAASSSRFSACFGRIDVLLEERAVRRAQLFELLERRKLRDRHGPIIAP